MSGHIQVKFESFILGTWRYGSDGMHVFLIIESMPFIPSFGFARMKTWEAPMESAQTAK